jgi:hypothetical protein
MGEAHTTVTQTLGDGTRIEQNATTKFYCERGERLCRAPVRGPAPDPITASVDHPA